MTLVELFDLFEARIEFGELIRTGQGGDLVLAFAVFVLVQLLERAGGIDVDVEQRLESVLRVDAIAILRWVEQVFR